MTRASAQALWVLALALLALGNQASAQPTTPRPESYVVDQTDALADADRQSLSARLAALDDSTSVQMVVVTTRLQGVPAADLARWMLGSMRLGRAGLNNGVLVLLAPADHQVYVSVGTGLEWQIPDHVAAAAVGLMLPLFRDEEYALGLSAGVDALSERATSVPWATRFRSASEAADAGDAALGQVVRLQGTYSDGALQTEAGPVALAFPPYWDQVQRPPLPGEALDLLARIAGTAPLSVQVLGPTPDA